MIRVTLLAYHGHEFSRLFETISSSEKLLLFTVLVLATGTLCGSSTAHPFLLHLDKSSICFLFFRYLNFCLMADVFPWRSTQRKPRRIVPFTNSIFLSEMPVFISPPRKCNEQILVSFVNEKLRPTSLRIFCSHCFRMLGSFGKVKNLTLFPCGSTRPVWLQREHNSKL